jgi:hypothetical protein
MSNYISKLILAFGLFVCTELVAQTPDNEDVKSTEASQEVKDKEKGLNPNIQHNYILNEDIKLAKDLNYQFGERNVENSLRAKNDMKPDDKRSELQKNLAKIKVITPAAYEALPETRKVAIDANPLYFVTEKTQRQKMADFLMESSFKEPASETPKEVVKQKSTFGDSPK